MKSQIPGRLATIGGVSISVSGVVNTILGARIGVLLYDAYPGGRMGDVGIIAGIAAVAIGLVIVFIVVPIYTHKHRGHVLLAGILTIVLGHAGGIAGAIYVGTVGVVLCYVAGIWLFVAAARRVTPHDS